MMLFNERNVFLRYRLSNERGNMVSVLQVASGVLALQRDGGRNEIAAFDTTSFFISLMGAALTPLAAARSLKGVGASYLGPIYDLLLRNYSVYDNSFSVGFYFLPCKVFERLQSEHCKMYSCTYRHRQAVTRRFQVQRSIRSTRGRARSRGAIP